MLASNQLTGTIPSQLGNLSTLTSLILSGNQLSGNIPTQLGSIDPLNTLYLDGNPLSGCIPNALSSVESNDLERLGLPFCACTNTIALPDPEDPNLDADCTILLTAKDTLRGTAPLNWTTTTLITSWNGITVSNNRVSSLGLHNKQLNGSIPSQLGNLSKLTSLILSSNQLTSSIPSQLGKLKGLNTLYLSGNPLSGCIPNALSSVSSNDLERLGLQFCNQSASNAGSTAMPIPSTSAANDNPGQVKEARHTEMLYLPVIHR